METSASFEARYAPLLDPTNQVLIEVMGGRGEWAVVCTALGGDAAQGLMLFEGFDVLQDGIDHEFVAEF
jgi:hypothetical protein